MVFSKICRAISKGGELVIFDRSWYNRAMVEPVFGFCTQKEYDVFMRSVQRFEEDLIDHGFHFLKFIYLYQRKSKQEDLKRERKSSKTVETKKLICKCKVGGKSLPKKI